MEQSTGKNTIRFLSFSNDDDEEKTAKLREAALKIEQAIAKEKTLNELIDYQASAEETTDLANDTRPLFERLMEQKNKRKDEIEDSHKLSNLVSRLDEEDVRYLNEVAKAKQDEELKIRLEVYDVLEEKRRLDEKKIDLEEQKRKERLLAAKPLSSRGSSSKTKFHISIRIKPKLDLGSSTPMKKDKDNQDDQSEMLRSDQTIEKAKEDNTSKNGEAEFSFMKCQDGKGFKKVKLNPDSKLNCNVGTVTCGSPVESLSTSIGILASLPIVSKLEDTSDESNSDDELERRLVPNLGSRRKRK